MDPSACRVIYIDDRFNTERWISREGLSPMSPQRNASGADFHELPLDLQTNVNAFLSVFNQVYVCNSGRSFSTKLSELHDSVKADCTPILACFDVGNESQKDHYFRSRPKFNPASDSPMPSPLMLRREITFSSESDESYGLQLLSRISSDLQVDEGAKLIIPVAVVQPKRNTSVDLSPLQNHAITRSPYGSETVPAKVVDTSDSVDGQMMYQCLEAGALDVVKSPLDKAGIMGLTVHAYRIYKAAKREQASFMASAHRSRKQSWVGVEEEQPYAYLREAMVRKLLKGICEPETVIEDYQHRDLWVEEGRKSIIAREVGKWSFCGHDFTEDELVYAGYCMLNHALSMPELTKWRIPESDLLHFMQGCRVAYNSFVLYHNFRHAVDVLQSLFYFLCQIGSLPPYPAGSTPPPLSNQKSPVARLIGSFDALTLLISAIGHDVGHPGVNNMFLVKLNAPLAQLYNDQSVLEAFHCAAYSQILRRHWPSAFNDKALRRLMISSILATDMGVHSDYMQQLGKLQEKVHESTSTDSWTPKEMESFRILTCGLLIKCADISNVARPWAVAEKWTHLLQKEFAHQGEMESAVGMETTLFGGPPELGNMLKLANGQIGFMTIFAHPLFYNVADIIPAMHFAADEILANKSVWFTRAEHEKKKETLRRESGQAGGNISPRTQSPVGGNRKALVEKEQHSEFQHSPLRAAETPGEPGPTGLGISTVGSTTPPIQPQEATPAAVGGIPNLGNEPASRKSSGASKTGLKPPRKPSMENRRSNNSVNSQHQLKSNSTTPVVDQAPLPSSKGGSDDLEGSPNSPQADLPQSVGGKDGANDSFTAVGAIPREGSGTIPFSSRSPSPPKRQDRPSNTLKSFTFASNDSQSPSTSDPPPNFPTGHGAVRASVPVNRTPDVQSSPHDTSAAKTSSPEVTRPIPEKSESMEAAGTGMGGWLSTSPLNSDFESRRNRAASAPMQIPRSSPGMGSPDPSKSDVRATVMNGGLGVEGLGITDDREDASGRSGTMRRRSRIRLKFWKKRSNTGASGGSGGEPGASVGDSDDAASQT